MKAAKALLILTAFVFLVAGPLPTFGQGFGKNKITYEDFEWQVYRSPHFDVHYYAGMEDLIEDVINEAESAYLDISRRLDHEIRTRIPLVLYRTHADFQQTNIVLQEIPEAVGAFAEPFMGRMVLPIDDPPDKRYKLIRHELVHVFQFDILYGESLRRTLRGQPPLWLMEGMASYLADDEDSFDQMIIRDAVVNNLVPSVRQLNVLSFLTYRYGHAIFDFMEERFGPDRVRTFLFEFRKILLAQNLEKAFQDTFGYGIDAFDREFARFLRKRYLPILTEKRSPDEYGDEIGFSRPGIFTFSPALSPSGDLVATLSNKTGLELDVVILSAREEGEVVRNLTRGFTNAWENIVAEAFEGKRDLAWSPTGDELAFFVKKGQHRPLVIFDPIEGRRLDMVTFEGLAQNASPAFSPDGRSIAFSANKNGVWDIFIYDIDSGELRNATSDRFFDSNPRFTHDGSRLIYNRRIGPFEKIFLVDLAAPERKTQLTAGAASDIQPIMSRDEKWIYFSSDRGEYGVFNLHRLSLETGEIERLTDLVGGAFAPVELPAGPEGTTRLAYSAFFAGTFRLFELPLAGEDFEEAVDVGEREPPTSPLAPSRIEQRLREEEAEELGEEAPAPPEPDEVADADLEPFRPPLELGLDDDRFEPYEVSWSIDAPQITVGVTDDGTILGNAQVTFSDLLGDQRAIVSAFSRDDFTNYQVTYLNLKRRWDWGAQLYDYRDYFLIREGGFLEPRRQTRLTSLTAFASYPFNRYWRFEANVGYAQRRQDFPLFVPQTNSFTFTRFSDDFPIAGVDIVHDTVRYQRFGPFQGNQIRLGVTAYTFTAGDNSGENVVSYNLDWRGYQMVTRRSQLAGRISARIQRGEAASYYTIGGINQIRGVDFRRLFGDNYAYVNLEYRLPLINFLQWGFGLITSPIRAFVFADVGSAWFHEQEFFNPDTGQIEKGRAVYDPFTGRFREFSVRDDDDKLQDVYASIGAGIQVPLLGLPATWSFSRRYDGDDLGPWSSSFYIVYDW